MSSRFSHAAQLFNVIKIFSQSNDIQKEGPDKAC